MTIITIHLIMKQYILNNLIDKSGFNSKLALSCLYILNMLSETDVFFYDIGLYINNLFNDKSTIKDFNILICALYTILLSYYSIYDLPCMLNKNISNKKISPHIVFGEALIQLSTLTLITETQNTLMNLSNLRRLDILIIINNNINNYIIRSDSTSNFIDIKKEHVQTDITQFKKTVFTIMIKSILLLNNISYEKIELYDDNIEAMLCNILSNTNNINYNLIRNLIQEIRSS